MWSFLLLFAFPLYVVWAVIKICILMIQFFFHLIGFLIGRGWD